MYIGLAESFLNQSTRRTWSPGLGEVRLQGSSTELRATQDTVTVFSENTQDWRLAGNGTKVNKMDSHCDQSYDLIWTKVQPMLCQTFVDDKHN